MVARADIHELGVTKEEEAAYYKAARAWDDERIEIAQRSRRTAWVIAALACVIAVVLAVAVAGLTPLKEVEPYLVRVDSSTGIVEPVVKVRDAVAELSKDELMNRYFLRKYVTLRESYNKQQLQSNYDQLALLSTPQVRDALRTEWQLGTPTSPYTRFGNIGTAKIQITHTTFLAGNIGQVRYVVTERRNGVEIKRYKIATIEFRYVARPTREDVIDVNPVGFQASTWRADEEAVAAE